MTHALPLENIGIHQGNLFQNCKVDATQYMLAITQISVEARTINLINYTQFYYDCVLLAKSILWENVAMDLSTTISRRSVFGSIIFVESWT